jgi:hypothetical protein
VLELEVPPPVIFVKFSVPLGIVRLAAMLSPTLVLPPLPPTQFTKFTALEAFIPFRTKEEADVAKFTPL